jgi:hypothetical protein
MADKIIRDGKVAILISHNYGTGWSSDICDKKLREKTLFCPVLVEKILNKASHEELEKIALEVLGAQWVNEDLTVEWIPVGTKFRVGEYDGSEYVEIFDEEDWTIA